MRQLLLQAAAGPAVELLLLDGVTSGTSEAIAIPSGQQISMTCVYTNDDGTTISAGVVALESAREEGYAGTWNNEGSSNAAANTTDRVAADGPENFWRVRVSTPIVGGTVKVYLKALGEY